VDQQFWELETNPWVVRNLLDHFARFYSYHDQVKDPKTGELFSGGISFCHDMGVNNQFSPLGRSSYEIKDLPGCFSYMTQEQLCNWVLLAASYVVRTGDIGWAQQRSPLISACFESMLNRDSPPPTGFPDLTGVMNHDSSRCGTGQEITTYDSLDESLGQARQNLYLAVKCWATYLGLAQLFELLGDGLPQGTSAQEAASNALDAATAVARRVISEMRPEGYIPAVFDKENKGYGSKILPAVEGLVYPLYWSRCADRNLQAARRRANDGKVGWLAPQGPYATLIDALRRHTETLLTARGAGAGKNRFADGGLKLSSTSDNSWMSKIAIFQEVCREVLGLDENGKPWTGQGSGFPKADAAHVRWETQGASAYWACSDQMVSGVAQGSKYYPRIVTTVLWLGSKGR
jgi:hypothetical protein